MAKQESHDLTRLFRALAADTRRRILHLLSERTLCVGALSNLLAVSAGAVSQHLRALKDADLVEADRRGYFIHYRLAPGAVERCRAATESLFAPRKGGRRRAPERRSARGRRT